MRIIDTTTRKGNKMLINMNPKPDGTIHAGYRISYTHTDGSTCQTNYCYTGRGELEEFFQRSRGIAKVDCVGILVYHDSLCNNLGEIPKDDFYRKGSEPRKFKWTRIK